MSTQPLHRHGGVRRGAGRPAGEPTAVVRIPASLVPQVAALKSGRGLRHRERPSLLLARAGQDLPLSPRPAYHAPAPQAGFPSPAADYLVEDALDLNRLLVRNPPATYFVRVKGDSMVDARIFDGDLVVVDRSVDPRPGAIVIAEYDGDLYVKRLRRLGRRLALCSENERCAAGYPPMFLDAAQQCTVWGVVTGVVRTF